MYLTVKKQIKRAEKALAQALDIRKFEIEMYRRCAYMRIKTKPPDFFGDFLT